MPRRNVPMPSRQTTRFILHVYQHPEISWKGPRMAESSPSITEPTTETFEKEVIERSRSVLVIVDFWAPWCEPCRQLAPLLEQFANEYAGKFVLAKINVDEAQEVATAFGVQSIPHVVAVRDGQPINQFQGLLPEPQLREWLESMLPSPADELVTRGIALEADEPAAAEQCYRQAAQLAPKRDDIEIALARVLMAQNRDEEAASRIADLESRGFLEPEAENIKSQLELRSVSDQAGGVDEARKTAEANPDDLDLQLTLADALAVAQQHEEALEICLSLVQRDRVGMGEKSKDTMLKIFALLGPESELVGQYRRKLATALY